MKIIGSSILALFIAAYSLDSPLPEPSPSANQPHYTADGKLQRPDNYREWVFLSSGLGMNYGPTQNGGSAPPAFTNVFVNPESYREFLKTGQWPDKTMFALEIYTSAVNSPPNKRGNFQDTLEALEMEVKDSSKPDLWRYYDMSLTEPATAPLPKAAGCFACHDANAAVEHSFTQFYPALLDVAIEKGTIKKGISVPLNAHRWSKVVTERGWAAAEAAYREDKAKHPESLLTEGALNSLGYALLSNKKTTESIAVFELVTREYPTSANAFDSLADAYTEAGRVADARHATNKELELVAADGAMPAARKKSITDAANERLEKLKSAK
ncbi:MAG: cytochrome P460 family protein [Acidobacteriales bacterium]|nr:cytochrome P460 family protein [Terriglobales bacterium]